MIVSILTGHREDWGYQVPDWAKEGIAKTINLGRVSSTTSIKPNQSEGSIFLEIRDRKSVV